MLHRKSKSYLPKTIDKSEKVESVNKDHRGSKTYNSNGRSKYKIYWRYIFLLIFSWLSVIHYYERIVVARAMKQCLWTNWEKWPKDARSYKVNLYADPQILDNYSYPNRTKAANYVVSFIVDNYLKRNWKYSQYYLNPDTNIFLGDLFDGGRYWDDDYWHEEYIRFNKLFPQKPDKRTIMSVAGNHDIGFGDTIIEKSFKRFSTYFGETSASYEMGNHTFVLLDTIALSNKVNKNISDIPKEFLNNFASQYHPLPRIMLSHIPLYRDPRIQPCGSERESKRPFPLVKGNQFQTIIEYDISQYVLQSVEPRLLFSGDDHDYCHIKHDFMSVKGVKVEAEEITVKSCAMNMGISRPAIQLLSLYNPDQMNEKETYQTTICYLPDPFKPLKMYLLTALLNIFVVVGITLFPGKFNSKIVTRLERFRERLIGRPKNEILPMPINTSKSIRTKIIGSDYYVDETLKSKRGFFIHALILIVAVFCIFAFYYNTI